jgi:predicted outer membrane protein
MIRMGCTAAAAAALMITAVSAGAQQSSGQLDSRAFVEKLTIAGMTEVELGKMAATHAASADVKAFGQMMVTDHTKAGQELKQVASQLNIQQPTELDQHGKDLSMRLSKLQGAEFDREYMKAMVTAHENVTSMLGMKAGVRITTGNTTVAPGQTTAAGGSATVTPGATVGLDATLGTSGTAGNEDALTQWAKKTLPTTQHHLARAREIQMKVK